MGKLIGSTFVTLDGVISEPQKWASPYWDDQYMAYARKLLFDADALLLGRVTYEGFARAWPSRSGDDYTDRINSMPKYVASNTLHDATWNASIISGDVASEVAKLKANQNLLKFGTGQLDRTLIQYGLVDEFHFWMFPAAAGDGQHLFDGLDKTTHLKLLDKTTFDSGIVVLVYGAKE
jgi:dihydrofolate reductase